MHKLAPAVQGLQRVKRALVSDDLPPIQQRRSVGWYGIALFTLAVVYVGTGRLGLSLGPAYRFATLIWLPSGLAVAALFLWGADLWPAITLGAFLVNVFTGAPVLVAVGISIGNTLEALVCSALLRRANVRSALDSLHDVLVLVLVAAPLSALISATLGVGSLSLGRIVVWSAAPITWTTWWLGDVMSMVLVTSLLLTWRTLPKATPSRKRLAELALLSVSVLVVCVLVFLSPFPPHAWGFPHLVFPLLTWVALRFGPRGATAVMATVAGFAILGTVLGSSPYSTGSLLLRLYYLQTFLGITAATTLILAAIVSERDALEQRKDEFISMAGHEVRTPLTSLQISIQLLQRDWTDSDHPHTLSTLARMETQVKKLSRLMADLLDLSKIQVGKLTFVEEALDLDALVREVVEQFQPTAPQHRIRIEGSAPGTIMGDRERLGQVLINLLSNATKFSPQAEQIIVHLTSTAQDLTVSVQDFGIGIPASEQQKVFDRFYRITGGHQPTVTGLGIGLYIAQQIIEHYGGKLWVDSTEGRGSTFSFWLPQRSR